MRKPSFPLLRELYTQPLRVTCLLTLFFSSDIWVDCFVRVINYSFLTLFSRPDKYIIMDCFTGIAVPFRFILAIFIDHVFASTVESKAVFKRLINKRLLAERVNENFRGCRFFYTIQTFRPVTNFVFELSQ